MTSQQIPDTNFIIERLNKLERQNHRLGVALALVGILAACLIFPGARFHRGRTITARRIVLQDENGTTRAILGMRSAGPGLTLYDENGENVQALLTVLKTGPVLSLYDANGATRVLLGVTPKGATLAFNDAKGNLRAEMGFLSNAPSITFFDSKGKPVYLAH
ncbi:MAG TPA: hypothetical protein VMI06_07270 [Terriglobia bacterium]|nr:hypothetical protein [Terriglobia bacterium]